MVSDRRLGALTQTVWLSSTGMAELTDHPLHEGHTPQDRVVKIFGLAHNCSVQYFVISTAATLAELFGIQQNRHKD